MRIGRFGWWLPVVLAPVGGLLLVPVDQAASLPTASATTGGVSGAVAYQEYCSSCHGSNGRGSSRGPSLAGVGAAAVDFELTTGRMPKRDEGTKPPPYKPVLTPQAIAALDRYVTGLVAAGGPTVPAVDPSAGDVGSGGELFRQNCAACHGWGGSGGVLNDRSVPSLSEASAVQIGEAIRVGPAQMPVFGPSQLSQHQVDSITAYVQAMQRPDDRGGDNLSRFGPVAEGAVAWLIGMALLLVAIRLIGQRG